LKSQTDGKSIDSKFYGLIDYFIPKASGPTDLSAI